MSGWQPFPVQVGDWVVVVPLDQMAPVAAADPPGGKGYDLQPGCTYQVSDLIGGREVGQHGVSMLTVWSGQVCGYLGWCRPATPEEIAAVQLAQLAGGGL